MFKNFIYHAIILLANKDFQLLESYNPIYIYKYICMYVCTYVSMYVCMYACMYVCMYVCISVVPHKAAAEVSRMGHYRRGELL